MTFVDFSPAVPLLGAQLESLAVHGLAFDQHALERLPLQCPGLTALSLRRCHFNPAHMRLALSRLAQLQTLGLVGHEFDDSLDDIRYMVEQCPQLTGLSLEGSGYDNNQLLCALPPLPLLTRLNIAAPKMQRLHWAKLVRDVLQQCARLTCLTVAGCTIVHTDADGWLDPVLHRDYPCVAISALTQLGNQPVAYRVGGVPGPEGELLPAEVPMPLQARWRVCDYALHQLND